MIDIPAHYFHTTMASATRKGLDPVAICKQLGIDPAKLLDSNSSIEAEQFSALWSYLWDELSDEFLGFTNKPSKRGTFSTACKLACRSPNFKHFFREMTRIYTLVESDIVMALEPIDNLQALTVVNHAPEYDINHFIIEYILFYWHRLACWFSNQQIKPLYAELSFPKPAHAALYKDIFQCPIKYNCSRNALFFNDNFKDLQPIRSRTELYEFLKRLPADFLSIPGNITSLETRIKILILKQSKQQLSFPSLEQLADSLHMSRTSLGRKLAAENTSYRQLKELIRRDLTIEKLSRSSMNIADIAQLVGFSESASLNRAFKNWTGLTPQQFRGKRRQLA